MTDDFNSADGDGRVTIQLPRIDDLTWEQRFELRMRLPMWPASLIATPRRLVRYRNGVEVFAAIERDEHRITYERVGIRQESPLESWMTYRYTDALLDDDRLYMVDPHRGLTVFDVSAPRRIEKIGHYITPDDSLRCLARLPDGRIAAFGRSMHVFALD